MNAAFGTKHEMSAKHMFRASLNMLHLPHLAIKVSIMQATKQYNVTCKLKHLRTS